MKNFHLVVVGAGPGGLAAAATAADLGMRICLVDDNATCGGQIWRSALEEPRLKGPAAKWFARIQGRSDMWFGWRAVAAPSTSILRVESNGAARDIRYSALVLATGARELFLPFPGWTLPGVYGVGGLQAFVKSGLEIRNQRIVVAGTGPLLLAVAAGLRKAGAHVVAVVEQATTAQLARFSVGLLAGHARKLLEGAGYAWATRGIPYITGAWVREASGDGRLRTVTVDSGSRVYSFNADMLAVGYHLVPNLELAQLMGCELESGFVRVDAFQQTSVQGVYCAGETTGIGGVDKAQIEGRIAALAAAGRVDSAQKLTAARDREKRFALQLDATFALRQNLRKLADENTIVCRCEDVRHGELRQCHSWREAKLHTRCGMGPCQGRICGPATRFLYGWDIPLPRPPLFPASVATLSASTSEPSEQRTVSA
jgi:NADPH-dependent 2,4-dienoyl-CoA reductase/sulfur reductase-like enzyme